MTEIEKRITIKFVISPNIFHTKDYKDKICDQIIEMYTQNMYDNEYIVEVLHIYKEYIKYPIIDPISGNMTIDVIIKAKCLKLQQDDEIKFEVTNIVDRGIFGVCNEGVVNVIITQQHLKDWKYNEREKIWVNGVHKIELKSRLYAKIISWKYETSSNTIRCFAKLR